MAITTAIATIAATAGSIGLGAAQSAGAFDKEAPELDTGKSKKARSLAMQRAAAAQGRSSSVIGQSGPSGSLGSTSLLGS